MWTWIKEKLAVLQERTKGWKTIIAGAIISAAYFLLEIGAALQMVDLQTAIPEPWGLRISMGINVTMIALRLITTGPVGSKGDVVEPEAKAGD